MTEKTPAGEHPSAERLVAYRAGELTAAEQEAMRDHLALCRECTDILLDLAGESRGPDPERDAAWEKVLPGLRRHLAGGT